MNIIHFFQSADNYVYNPFLYIGHCILLYFIKFKTVR